MPNQIKNLDKFVNSDYNSAAEKAFLDSDLQAYYKQKLASKYSQILETEHNVAAVSADSTKSKNKSFSTIIITVISILAFLAAAFFTFNSLTTTEEKPKSQFAYLELGYIEMEGASRGAQSSQEIALQEIKFAYANQNFSDVIEQYGKLNAENITQDVRLQAAIAFANENQYDQSVELYTDLLSTVTAKGQLQEIQWSAFTMYMEFEKKDKALDLFQQMGPDHERYMLAKEILGN